MSKWIARFLILVLLLGSMSIANAENKEPGLPQEVIDFVNFFNGETLLLENMDLDQVLEPTEMQYGVAVQGQHELRHIDVMQYKYIGEDDRVVQWKGYPYVYVLVDNDRNIMACKANNEYHEKSRGIFTDFFLGKEEYATMKDADLILWGAGENCREKDAVDAYALIQTVYDYYAKRFGWRGPDGEGREQIFLFTGVDRDHGGTYESSSANDNAITSPASGTGVQILFGQRWKEGGSLAAYLDVVAHEYTHAVLYGHGVSSGDNNLDSCAAIHEGYADVMAVCIDTGDWNINTKRSLADPGGKNHVGTKCLSHVDELKPSTESHKAGTILGHAAYLMCVQELGAGRGEGSILTRWQLSQLFFTSMKYLSDTPDFHNAGLALMRATRELLMTVSDDTVNMVLTEENAVRIVWALNQVGIDVALEDGFVFYTPKPSLTPTPKPTPMPEPTPIHINTITTPPPEFSGGPNYEDYLRSELVRKYGVMPTETVYDTEDRSDSVLKGILNAHYGDFDEDGADELLISRFNTEEGADGSSQLLLTLEMYEIVKDKIQRRAQRQLIVPGLTEVMGLYGSEIAAFLFRQDGEMRIGLETFFGINENTVTVVVYSYDGEDFCFESGTCHEAYGSGDTYVRYAATEPSSRHTLSGADWRILLDEADEPWVTLDQYVSGEPDWAMISPEEDIRLADLYRELLGNSGLKAAEDRRVLREALPDYATGLDYDELYNSQFTRDLYLIYGETEPFELLWQVLSWQPLGGPLMLERQDYGTLLERYREQ